MPRATAPQRVGPGWVVEVAGHRVGDTARAGEILEILGSESHPHYRVRWEDGHESVYFPGSDVALRPPKPARPKRRPAQSR